MALFVKQQQERSELQERIAAELREKSRLQNVSAAPADLGKAHDYDQQQNTRVAGMIISVLGLLLIAVLVWWASSSQN
jgi:hypothetical protein